jgi:hypothetical protein
MIAAALSVAGGAVAAQTPNRAPASAAMGRPAAFAACTVAATLRSWMEKYTVTRGSLAVMRKDRLVFAAVTAAAPRTKELRYGVCQKT